jgi:hypothetical protein
MDLTHDHRGAYLERPIPKYITSILTDPMAREGKIVVYHRRKSHKSTSEGDFPAI